MAGDRAVGFARALNGEVPITPALQAYWTGFASWFFDLLKELLIEDYERLEHRTKRLLAGARSEPSPLRTAVAVLCASPSDGLPDDPEVLALLVEVATEQRDGRLLRRLQRKLHGGPQWGQIGITVVLLAVIAVLLWVSLG